MSARVLVIDDSLMMVQLITQALAGVGLAADAATNLGELDQRLAAHTYDLVLVDVNMPEMYGDDVVEFLKVQRQLKARLYLYSDIPEDELAAKAKNVGAEGYITKASGLEAAVEIIQKAVSGAPKKRVLVVDDSEATARLLEVELTGQGHEVMTANSADAATKIILKKKTRPDLVLLDVHMPGVNGEEFCRFIKGNSLFAGIQVVLCSAEEESELQRIVASAGADGYVRKDSLIAREILDLLT
ncbi:MAG: two-component system response regulator [Archangium gephyra]|uniref:Two-component system response regulator n=1 Tax=Archangium gephyra TaxID=48 RepID=A0A2W5TVM3_9BACT|nr:MAG: two-component system response regulator [Archangium gephyra]